MCNWWMRPPPNIRIRWANSFEACSRVVLCGSQMDRIPSWIFFVNVIHVRLTKFICPSSGVFIIVVVAVIIWFVIAKRPTFQIERNAKYKTRRKSIQMYELFRMLVHTMYEITSQNQEHTELLYINIYTTALYHTWLCFRKTDRYLFHFFGSVVSFYSEFIIFCTHSRDIHLNQTKLLLLLYHENIL